ncbi:MULTISPECIES: hypothetical protein [Methylobacterium]|jgi:hypothetical protein|uniref:Uncharacterized protein n=1 Tax=Methylobacterium longum TaxID=767694 RepID=A0ABT8AUW4_9HYPH|nr:MULTISPECIES: hypothetical protein [Methylobacterium]MCJ2098063.1 hypothetical protein [Methylobacterium sp. E-046]MDN3573525.1 hypothetical protein [Methylobacterium longum]GJE10201.1 hypothetical protein FOHLNKBM_1234 [Methylobacterium longum]
MPLKRYMDGGAHILPADETLIRFAMTNGERVIGIDVPIPVLRRQFGGGDDLAPLDLFARNQAVIEAAASQAYDRTPTPNDLLDMGPEDFGPAASGTPPAPAKL